MTVLSVEYISLHSLYHNSDCLLYLLKSTAIAKMTQSEYVAGIFNMYDKLYLNGTHIDTTTPFKKRYASLSMKVKIRIKQATQRDLWCADVIGEMGVRTNHTETYALQNWILASYANWWTGLLLPAN